MASDKSIFQARVNNFLFSFTQQELEQVDLIEIRPGEYNLIIDHRTLNAKIIEEAWGGKKLRVEAGGNSFLVEIKDEFDVALETMGFGTRSNKTVKEIKAPMPGLVLEIAVIDGQEVKEGDKLLILEAMKMENSIMIHTQARIKKIAVAAGQAVEKGQLLAELE